jgi:NAD(P)-dependent dehydrogenase (short-subunit alcohol dehydrogenase family)/acyl carrier protein
VRKEHPELVCRAIDLDAYTTTDQFFAELEAVTDLFLVAYRTGTRFVKEFTEIDIERTAEQKVEIKEDGVYLITGGLGGIGLEVARYFAEQNRVRLVLMNRSAMPERESWQEILSLGTDESLCQKIRDIQDIESRGATVQCVSVDVANREQLRLVLAGVREKYGQIDGIVHGAGVSSDESILVRKPADAQNVFEPKLYGTWNLDMLTREDNPDFLVLFSSIATLFSAPNQADYIAANTYLDSYAAHRNKQGLRTLTINWSTWKETGMSVRHNINTDTLFKAIHTRDAITGLDRALNKSISRALIGEIHYDGQLIFLLERNLFRLSPKITAELAKRKSLSKGNADSSSAKTATLSTTGDASYLEIERNIYETCKKALGFDDISIYDNFFELGADSILLTRMHALLDKEYPGVVVVTDIFEHTTIHRLAQYIYGKTSTPAETVPEQKEENLDDALRSIFDQLENDDIDIEAALNNLKGI